MTIKKELKMTNDGWGKPKGWTTQQAVDKAVEKLQRPEPSPTLVEVVKNVAEAKKDLPPFKNAGEWPKGTVVGWDLGKQDITKAFIIDQSVEAAQIEIVKDPKELEFLLARQVQLNLSSKLFKTDGLQVGDLVIHDEGEYVVISHVPTLRQFMQAVPTDDDKEYTDDQLVKWCTKVQLAHKEDWAILRALTYETSIAKDAKTMEAASHIRDWCLSVEIE